MLAYWKRINPPLVAYDEKVEPFDIVTLKYDREWEDKGDCLSISGRALHQLTEELKHCKNFINVIDITALDHFDNDELHLPDFASFLRNHARMYSALIVATSSSERREKLNGLIHKDGSMKIFVYATLVSQFTDGFSMERKMLDANLFMQNVKDECAKDVKSVIGFVDRGEVVKKEPDRESDMELMLNLVQEAPREGRETPEEDDEDSIVPFSYLKKMRMRGG